MARAAELHRDSLLLSRERGGRLRPDQGSHDSRMGTGGPRVGRSGAWTARPQRVLPHFHGARRFRLTSAEPTARPPAASRPAQPGASSPPRSRSETHRTPKPLTPLVLPQHPDQHSPERRVWSADHRFPVRRREAVAPMHRIGHPDAGFAGLRERVHDWRTGRKRNGFSPGESHKRWARQRRGRSPPARTRAPRSSSHSQWGASCRCAWQRHDATGSHLARGWTPVRRGHELYWPRGHASHADQTGSDSI
jgi:hypothetical protein